MLLGCTLGQWTSHGKKYLITRAPIERTTYRFRKVLSTSGSVYEEI
jgi:hypothetical protein